MANANPATKATHPKPAPKPSSVPKGADSKYATTLPNGTVVINYVEKV